MVNQIARNGNTLSGGQPVDEKKTRGIFGTDSSFLASREAIYRGYPQYTEKERLQKWVDTQQLLKDQPENTSDILMMLHVEMVQNIEDFDRTPAPKTAGFSYSGSMRDLLAQMKENLGVEA